MRIPLLLLGATGALFMTFESTAEARDHGGFSRSQGIANRSFSSTRPSLAFGGTPFRRFDSVNAWRDNGSVRGFRSSGGIPFEGARHWDLGHRHFWNHHFYGWNGADWVIIDDGVGPYDDAYGASVPEDAEPPASDPIDSDQLAIDVQRALSRRGYNPGPIDGALGSQTRGAISAFQSEHGMEPTGHISADLLDKLGLK